MPLFELSEALIALLVNVSSLIMEILTTILFVFLELGSGLLLLLSSHAFLILLELSIQLINIGILVSFGIFPLTFILAADILSLSLLFST